MLLNYARGLAESHTKESIKDTVITVPPFFGQAERKGLLDAAEIAGLNVLTLVNEPAGASLQYGIDKDFAVEDRHVVFYDMGASNTHAALVHFTAYTTKSPAGGKNITAQQFHVSNAMILRSLGLLIVNTVSLVITKSTFRMSVGFTSEVLEETLDGLLLDMTTNHALVEYLRSVPSLSFLISFYSAFFSA